MEERIKYPRLDLGQIEAFMNKIGGMTGLGQFLSGGLVVVAKAATNQLLEFIELVAVPTVKRFVSAEHFKHGEEVDGVKVSLGRHFQTRFGKKIEENVEGCDIRVHRLLRTSRDLGIRYEIGEDNEETFLAHLWHFLKLRGSRGGWFLFYIRDDEDVLWAVRADWSDTCWCVGARSVEDRCGWGADDCVCSR